MSTLTGSTLAGLTLAGMTLSGHVVGEQPVTSSVSFTVPSSDIFEQCQDNYLRGLIGGTLARCWIAFTQGTQRVPHFSHGGSWANPTDFVTSLAGASAFLVDLGSVSRTADEVAQLVVDAAIAAGVSGISRDGATITVLNASDLVIPPDVDMTDESLRGQRGFVRDDWGDGAVTLNANGGTNSTVSVCIGQPGVGPARGGRVIAVVACGHSSWGQSGGGPLLGASIGPAHSTNPASFTMLGEGQIASSLATGPNGGTFGAAAFEAAAFGENDYLWAHCRAGGGVGGIRYRLHGQTPVGRGTLGLGESMLVDTATDFNVSTPFGSTYTPTIVQTLNVGFFNIYGGLAVVVEFPDDAGNYPANGGLQLRFGDHNESITHGTTITAPPSTLDIETTWHRELAPDMTEINVVSIVRGIGALDVGEEDSRAGVYDFPDLDVPSTTAATLVADIGPMGLTAANAFNTLEIAAPGIAIGTDSIGAGRTIAIGFNYATVSGAALTTYELEVFLESVADSAFLMCWEDDPENWHDGIRGARGRGGGAAARTPDVDEAEYRTRTSTGNVGMPTADIADAFLSTMSIDTDAPPNGDDAPLAIAREWYVVERTGILAA